MVSGRVQNMQEVRRVSKGEDRRGKDKHIYIVSAGYLQKLCSIRSP